MLTIYVFLFTFSKSLISSYLSIRQFRKALQRLQTATTPPPRTEAQAALRDHELPVQMRVHRALRLWLLYADLEESLGTFESAKSVYARALELRVATPQLVINFAVFLEEKHYFEEAFAVRVGSIVQSSSHGLACNAIIIFLGLLGLLQCFSLTLDPLLSPPPLSSAALTPAGVRARHCAVQVARGL